MVGNYAFQWTDLHPTSSELEPFRYKYDELGSAAAKHLQEIARKTQEDGNSQVPFQTDLYDILRQHHANDEILANFWTEIHEVPDWIDWEQIKRGQAFFYRYAPANLMGFALQGFMGENSAAAGVAEVLVRTGGFSTRKLLSRLLETFQFVLQVTESLQAIQPGGIGHTAAVRVRLLHSSVRERILQLAKARPEYYDSRSFGEPINLLDSIHSICVFCCNHSWLQLPFMGVHPDKQETADYIALFRYVAYLLGTPDRYFATPATAKATMESILLRELRITPRSHVVAHNFVQSITDLPPFNVSKQFIEAGTRALNGDAFCDSLGLDRPGIYSYACYRGFCWLVSTLAIVQQASPKLDKLLTDYFRQALHDGFIESKSSLAGGTTFGFKHIPQIGKQSGKEDHGLRPPSSSMFGRPVETFLFAMYMLRLCLIVGVLLIVYITFLYLYIIVSARW